MPHAVISLNRSRVFEWYLVTRCDSKNECQKDIRLEEIDLYAQNVIIVIIGSMANVNGVTS